MTVSLPRIALTVVLVVVALVLQTTVLAPLRLPGATPDLVLVVLVALSLRYGAMFGTVAGFLTGLTVDLAPPADDTVGRWAFVLCLVGYLSGMARDDVERSPLVPLLAVALAAAGSLIGYAALGGLLGSPRVEASALVAMLPAAVLYDLLLAAFTVPLVHALARRADLAGQRR